MKTFSPTKTIKGSSRLYLIGSLAITASGLVFQNMEAAPTGVSGYEVSVFATAPANFKGPDSITRGEGKIYVTYTNGAAKDGSAGSSVVVQYVIGGLKD